MMGCDHTHLAILAPLAEYVPAGDIYTQTHELFHKDAWDVTREEIFRQLPMVHMARFQIIDHVYPGMGQEPPERPRSKFLLFIAELDGRADDFYDHLYNQTANAPPPFWPFWLPDMVQGAFVRSVWGNCAGYPTPAEDVGPVIFRQFMHQYDIPPYVTYEGAPGACLLDIFQVLLLKELTAAWVMLGNAAMAASYEDFMTTAARIKTYTFAQALAAYQFVFVVPPRNFNEIVNNIP